ncbi:MAG: glycosyltransferase family 39 protein [Myxococcota bacterium]
MSPSRGVTPLLRYAGAGAGLGIVSLLLPRELPAALAVFGALAVPVALWLASRPDRAEARVLVAIFLGAALTRAAVAITIAYGVPAEYFALDQRLYQRIGWEIAESWAGRGTAPEPITDKSGYYVWNALVYSVVGNVPLAAALCNAVAGGLSAILAYRLAGEVAGARAGRVAALLAGFFPSLVLWSSLNLKDAFAILAILAALRGGQGLQTRFSLASAALLAAGLLGLAQLRTYLVVVLAVSLAVGLVLPRLRQAAAPATLAVWLVLCVLVIRFAGSFETLTDGAALEELGRHRRNLALGESVYHGDVDISTPGRALRFLPIGLAYFLLAPAPWQLWNSRQWLTLPEMLAWYALLPQVFFGLRHALRTRSHAALPLATFALLGTVSYALVESNLGTAYRHRAQVLVLFLIFAAVGLATRHARCAASQRPAATPNRGVRVLGTGPPAPAAAP